MIRQGGRRRGANMAVLRVDYPDIEALIAAKYTAGRLENFNLSVGVTDAFLIALDRGERFALRNPRTGAVARVVDQRQLCDRIAAAWQTGDPGLLFLEEINRHNPTPALGPLAATNPCGEQPLLPDESCVLGSLNLAAFAGAGDPISGPGVRLLTGCAGGRASRSCDEGRPIPTAGMRSTDGNIGLTLRGLGTGAAARRM